ncbi:MAG: nucleotidyl transferase AbiEii/AbiGii toxin family protein [Saprospiraceae bacterium]|nr:nucleotidyl transferase AbiEii/AbiGii toxin family protein [Saprospiraceae bacterium]
MKNHKPSIITKLKNISRERKKVHQQTLIRYFQERLLYRLSISAYRENFFLKGGALIYAIEKEQSRLTKDIDFLAMKIDSDKESIKKIFGEICSISYSEDGVDFDTENITVDEIIEEGIYSGIRMKIPANLDNIKQNLQVDVGFGDVIIPGPVEMSYPTLLEMEEPKLQAYSVESLMAEKFETMISLGEANSRMKDFYDIYRILSSGNFDNVVLTNAVKGTFSRRETEVSKDHSLFNFEFYDDNARNAQWKAYLKKAKLDETIKFDSIHQEIRTHLKPIYDGIVKSKTKDG